MVLDQLMTHMSFMSMCEAWSDDYVCMPLNSPLIAGVNPKSIIISSIILSVPHSRQLSIFLVTKDCVCSRFLLINFFVCFMSWLGFCSCRRQRSTCSLYLSLVDSLKGLFFCLSYPYSSRLLVLFVVGKIEYLLPPLT